MYTFYFLFKICKIKICNSFFSKINLVKLNRRDYTFINNFLNGSCAEKFFVFQFREFLQGQFNLHFFINNFLSEEIFEYSQFL